MEITKPQKPDLKYQQLIGELKNEILKEDNNVLLQFKPIYHNKIIMDMTKINVYSSSVFDQSKTNPFFDSYIKSLIGGYLFLLEPSKYTIDVEDYITKLHAYFTSMLDDSFSLLSLMLQLSHLSSGDSGLELVSESIKCEAFIFIQQYSSDNWPNNLTQEEND